MVLIGVSAPLRTAGSSGYWIERLKELAERLGVRSVRIDAYEDELRRKSGITNRGVAVMFTVATLGHLPRGDVFLRDLERIASFMDEARRSFTGRRT